MIVVYRMQGTGTKIFISRQYKNNKEELKMSDNHDLLNDNNMCSFEEHEAENVCSNKDAVACGDSGSFV